MVFKSENHWVTIAANMAQSINLVKNKTRRTWPGLGTSAPVDLFSSRASRFRKGRAENVLVIFWSAFRTCIDTRSGNFQKRLSSWLEKKMKQILKQVSILRVCRGGVEFIKSTTVMVLQLWKLSFLRQIRLRYGRLRIATKSVPNFLSYVVGNFFKRRVTPKHSKSRFPTTTHAWLREIPKNCVCVYSRAQLSR